MTQSTLSASDQKKTVARQRLTAEQELCLVSQVQERTELLKRKKEGFTLDEAQIRIRGERAFNALLKDYQGLIWRLVYRYSFLNRITTDERYQIAMVAVEKAVSTHNPKRAGKKRKFSSWVFLKISSKFISLYRSELVHSRKVKSAYDGLRACEKPNEYKSPKPLPEVNLKEIILQEIESSLPESDAQILKDYYLHEYSTKAIALNFGYSTAVLNMRKRKSLKQLKTNPRLQELAEAYIA